MLRVAVAVLFALSLFPTSAVAEVFGSTDGVVLFSLEHSRPTTPIDADLKVSARFVWSQSGVRRASRNGKFERREVTVLNEPYDVNDASGRRWRMWIRNVAGKTVTVELVRVQPRTLPIQLFRLASVTVLDESYKAGLPPLTLFANGHYRLGNNAGRYRRDEGGITLHGAGSHWGRGLYAVDGEGLVFRFKRGPLSYEVRYQKKPDRSAEDEEEEDEDALADL